MKKIKFCGYLRLLLILILILSMLISTVSAANVSYINEKLVAEFKEETEETQVSTTPDEEEDWTDWIDSDSSVLSNISISNEFTPVKVTENNSFIFWYDTSGADVYLYDKRNKTIWSNAVDDLYYDDKDSDKALLTQLFSISVADEKDGITTFDFCDTNGNSNQFKITPSYESNTLILNFEMHNFEIEFKMIFEIEKNGLAVSIPSKFIKQSNGNRIVSISVMPYFGAARTDEQGYILIPDGSGAIAQFEKTSQKEERIYSYQLYGTAIQNMDELLERDKQDIKNMMLPVFGIRRENSAFLAAVTEGSENSVLNIVPNGFQCKNLARAYFTLSYVYTETLKINGKKFEQLMSIQELSDRKINYFILNGSDCDYSDMAAVYRDYLEENKILKEKINLSEPMVSLDVLMGVNKSGFFRDKYVKMTTVEELENILNDLSSVGVKAEITLQGWNDGGFTAIPTSSKISSGIGSKSKFINFTEFAKSKGFTIYLYNNFLESTADSKTVNLKKDVVRDYVGFIVFDKTKSKAMLNIKDTLSRQIEKARSTNLYKNSGFSLARVGQWLWNNYDKDNPCTRTQVLEACMSALSNTLEHEGKVQIYGGNQYVLGYADSLREIPDTSSGYYFTTKSVPFYQMVISGYSRYTSIAGNMSYDLNYQKLKWIEYGSTPYYVITNKNALELVDSDYDKLFSSEYSVWGENIKSIYEEYKGELSAISGAELLSHNYITDTLCCVKYNNNTTVYINYGDRPETVDGITVPAKDYMLISGKEGTK